MKVQWTRLPGALPTQQFVEQIKRLLDGPGKSVATKKSDSNEPPLRPAPAVAKPGFPLWMVAALRALVLGLGAFIALRPSTAKETPVLVPAAKPVAESKPAASAVPADIKS